MRTAHTKEVHLFHEVTGVEQALVQQIGSTSDESYLADTCNRTANSINNTVVGVFTHLQDNYSQLIPQKFLNGRTSSRRKFTTHATQSQPCSSHLRNFLSFLTSLGHHTRSYRRSTPPTQYSTKRASLGWKFASGIALQKYRSRGCDLNSFFGHLINS